jgi:hypothetical protein
MFSNIGRGWKIAGASWSVLKQHSKLLLLPLISGIAFIALLAAIITPVAMYAIANGVENFEDTVRDSDPILYLYGFGFYLACTFIIVFFNAALVSCALDAHAGKEPSLLRGLGAAVGRLPQILLWSLIAATVGMILNAIQSFLRENLGFLGSLLGSLGELAWAAMTYFVVPILVVDGPDPITAVKRSLEHLRRTWGEAVGGRGGLALVCMLLMLPVVFLVGIGAAVATSSGAGPAAIVALVALAFLYVVVLSIVFSTLGTIFSAGVYVYATTGKAPGAMDPELLQSAFGPKQGRRRR